MLMYYVLLLLVLSVVTYADVYAAASICDLMELLSIFFKVTSSVGHGIPSITFVAQKLAVTVIDLFRPFHL